jgi:5'-3' exonuclease
MPPELLAQFPLLEDGLGALGVTVWPMVDQEADDGLAAAARVARDDDRVDRAIICTVDKDLGQCVEDPKVVQLDRGGLELRQQLRVVHGVEGSPPIAQ